ncbi:MAG: hypothetical protein IT270_15325 [Saprospiraceae bacterium]|nr:hypothetical protein [Saprospiraceae bacterium]
MESFFEILKYTIPGLIVFATAYFLLKMILDDRQLANRSAMRQDAQKITLPLRLQAYERLTLLCDRVELQKILLRIRMPGMTVRELQGALLLSISQEFEHNASQQLYVSDTLWQIINLAKNQTMALVANAASDIDPTEDASLLVDKLIQEDAQEGQLSLLQRAIVAIRTEAGQLF